MARGVTVPATGETTGENGLMSVRPDGGLGVDEIVTLLATGAARPLRAGSAVSQLDHALQTAALLGHEYPDDPELAAAGLVHDIGHLLEGVDDRTHAAAGASAVRAVLGERVAGLVALHVEAKRYLLATERAYGDVLAPDSAASLDAQGGPLPAAAVAGFEGLPLATTAVALRRADDAGKAEWPEARDLGSWVPLLRELSERGGSAVR
jgi:predicted HD phosphohydrolase